MPKTGRAGEKETGRQGKNMTAFERDPAAGPRCRRRESVAGALFLGRSECRLEWRRHAAPLSRLPVPHTQSALLPAAQSGEPSRRRRYAPADRPVDTLASKASGRLGELAMQEVGPPTQLLSEIIYLLILTELYRLPHLLPARAPHLGGRSRSRSHSSARSVNSFSRGTYEFEWLRPRRGQRAAGRSRRLAGYGAPDGTMAARRPPKPAGHEARRPGAASVSGVEVDLSRIADTPGAPRRLTTKVFPSGAVFQWTMCR